MRKTISTIILILGSLNAKADYRYMDLSTLVCMADYGAVGTIVELEENYFYLKVDEYVLNELKLDTLKIQRFKDWSCGRRFEEYEIGQKELVFFQKSNNIIDDFELMGYGGGGEFELPIKGKSIYYFRYDYHDLQSYPLDLFLEALKDFNLLKQQIDESSTPISKEEQKIFASKSELHKLFIECNKSSKNDDFDFFGKAYIGNLEKQHLYLNYENKVYIFGFEIDFIQLHVDDAEIWKTDDYFIIKPQKSTSKRWLNVYSAKDKNKTNILYSQVFDIVELPEPKIYFGSSYSDTIYHYYDAIPTVAHYLGHQHKDEYLKYRLIYFTYTIESDGVTETFIIKSVFDRGKLDQRVKKLNPGDKITISDLYVDFPDKTVKKIKGRTIFFGENI